MDAFAAATDALFVDPNIGRDAIWSAGGVGAGIAVRVIVRRPDEVVGFGGSRTVVATVLIDVRVSEVAAPTAADTAEIGVDLFEVIGTPVRDSVGLVWTCEASARA